MLNRSGFGDPFARMLALKVKVFTYIRPCVVDLLGYSIHPIALPAQNIYILCVYFQGEDDTPANLRDIVGMMFMFYLSLVMEIMWVSDQGLSNLCPRPSKLYVTLQKVCSYALCLAPKSIHTITFSAITLLLRS
jgi:hypothetical protein